LFSTFICSFATAQNSSEPGPLAKDIARLEERAARQEKRKNQSGFRQRSSRLDGGHRADGSTITMTDRRQPDKILAPNQWIKTYCADHDDLYLDYFSAMVDDKGFLKKYLSEDGLHPNKAATTSWLRWPNPPSKKPSRKNSGTRVLGIPRRSRICWCKIPSVLFASALYKPGGPRSKEPLCTLPAHRIAS
jgi:hypothetical protein